MNEIITSKTTCSAFCALLVFGGIFLYKSQLRSNSSKEHKELNKKETKLWMLEDKIHYRVKEFKKERKKIEDDARLLEEQFLQQNKLKNELRNIITEIEKREKKLQEDINCFEKRIAEQKRMKVELDVRLKEVVEREKRFGQKNLEEHLNIQAKEIDELKTRVKEGHRLLEEERNKRNILQEELDGRGEFATPTTNAEEESAVVAILSSPDSNTATITQGTTLTNIAIDGDCTKSKDKDHQQEATTIENVVEPEITKEKSPSISDEPSESEKRKKMIDDEIKNIVKQANENELEESFDEDSIEALKKGASKICYVKKFYDVMKDEFIYFPSVVQTVLDYRLMEEAEKFYFDEDDKYPQDLSVGLRSVATELVLSLDDYDEEYMSLLAQDIKI